MPAVYSCRNMPTIQRFMDSDAFIRGLMGPFGSGKSSACTIEVGQRGVAMPPMADGVRRSRYAVIRNTNKELEDTTERTFMGWFPWQQFGDWTPSKHNYTIRALRADGDDRGAEIEVLFRALDRPDQIKDLLSLDLTGAWINEAREIDWPIVEALQARLGRYPPMNEMRQPYWFGMWMDTNAPDAESRWYKFFEEDDLRESVAELAELIPGLTVDTYRQIFKQPSGRGKSAENLENLQLGYYQRLAIGKTDEWVKVYIDGEYGFVVEGKVVWSNYVDAIHCPADQRLWPKPVHGLPIWRSWDFGLTPAAVYGQITPRGQWIVFDEMVADSMGVDRFSDVVLDHSAREYSGFEFRDVGDPAGMQRAQSDEKTCFQILHAKGILIEPAIQTLQIRLESVRRPLQMMIDGGRPQFQLHPRCKWLRRAMMGGYHFRRLRVSGERYSEQPEKNSYSHVADALGYQGTRLFGVALVAPPANDGGYPRHEDRTRSRVTGY